MHRNVFWYVFLFFLGVVVLWYGFSAGSRLYDYAVMTEPAEASALSWSIKKLGAEKFVPEVRYRFFVNGASFQGYTVIDSVSYRNSFAASEEVRRLQNRRHNVYYAKKNPSISALDPSFPLTAVLSAISLVGLYLYFIWLGFYVKSFALDR